MARGVRWVTAGLADQLVIATANAANTLLALVLLSRARAGVMILSLSLAYLVLGLNRAFVGDTLLALASRYDGPRRDRLVSHGLAAAVVAGVLAAAVLAPLGAAWPASSDVDLGDLVWVAPFLPLILLHDTGRYSYLAARQPERALVMDLVWVCVQAVAVVVLWRTGTATGGTLLAAWGLGATAGASVFLVRTGARPWHGRPRAWVTETRHLSGWFTATAVVGQFQVQAVNFLVAWRLTSVEVSGLRAAQTVVLQPVQNLITAVMGLLVPRGSRLARDAAVQSDAAVDAAVPAGAAVDAAVPAGAAAAAAALRRQTWLLAAVFGGLGLLLVLVVWPIAHTVLVRLPKFADIAPLALPISLQAGVYLLQTPFTAAMRAMHLARGLFGQYLVFSATSLTGLVLGAAWYRLPGAAWGLFTGAVVGLVVMVWSATRALRTLGQPAVEPAGSPVSGADTGSGALTG